MNRNQEVQALMVRTRDTLQELLRTSDEMQTLTTESVALDIKVILLVNICAINMGDQPLHLEQMEGAEMRIPEPITELPDWMKDMKISFGSESADGEDYGDVQPEYLQVPRRTDQPIAPDGGDLAPGSTKAEYMRVPNCFQKPPSAPPSPPPSDPHWHVLVESLPTRSLMSVQTCATWVQAELLMKEINQSDVLIASIPASPCHGDCPKVER